ncbi:hypothetical protein GE061_007186 [Apolygus lucorum]|uniref:Uncharacterized protein n=1 Tax=Apolygus lucorum TaxID=248454 RepID=A0A6A4JAL9_APOLU|nr:hypothetical protein GE061_007186 [Apolygus lucorum]
MDEKETDSCGEDEITMGNSSDEEIVDSEESSPSSSVAETETDEDEESMEARYQQYMKQDEELHRLKMQEVEMRIALVKQQIAHRTELFEMQRTRFALEEEYLNKKKK